MHAGLGLTIFTKDKHAGGNAPSAPQVSRALALHLVQQHVPGSPALPPHPTVAPLAPSAVQPDSQASSSHTPQATPVPDGLPYFLPHQVTAEASVAEGLSPGNVLVIPGMRYQPAVVRLRVGSAGQAEAVEFESDELNDEERRRVVEALLKLRFVPAKIGRIPVRSELRLEITIDFYIRA